MNLLIGACREHAYKCCMKQFFFHFAIKNNKHGDSLNRFQLGTSHCGRALKADQTSEQKIAAGVLPTWSVLARFQVLTAASMKMTVFWNVAPCSLVETETDDESSP
jgi:hypothetical protein